MTKNASGKRFRATFGGGYKKEDVNAYIEEIQADFTSVEATLKGQIDRQSAQIKAAEEAAATAKAELETLSARITALEAENAQYAAEKAGYEAAMDTLYTLRTENEVLTSENTALVEKQQTLAAEYLSLQTESQGEKERLAALLSEKEAALEVYRTKATDAEAKAAEWSDVAEKELSVLRDKAAAYDRMSAEFGATMLRANENAEAIVRSAEAEAEGMLKTLNTEIAAAKNRAQVASEGLIGTLDGRLRKINADCRDDIIVELEDLRSSVGSMLAAMKSKYAGIGARIDYAKTEMQSERDRVLRGSSANGRELSQRIFKKK